MESEKDKLHKTFYIILSVATGIIFSVFICETFLITSPIRDIITGGLSALTGISAYAGLIKKEKDE